MKTIPVLCGLAAILLSSAEAGDTRIWTSRKGSTIEAEFLSLDGESATLLGPESKQLVLKVNDLSLADRQYLVEVGGADPKILITGELGEPEKQVRIDSKTFKSIKDKTLDFGTAKEGKFELMESEHFLLASAGKVRAQAVAETAERLWHGMAFQHMNFRRDWGDKKMLVILAEDRTAHAAVGSWYQEHLKSLGKDAIAVDVGMTWDKGAGTSINLSEEMTEEYNVFPTAMYYNITQPQLFKKAMAPFVIHTFAKSLLSKQLGGVSSFGAQGYFAVLTGHGYFKEMSLAGKSETQLIAVTETSKEFSEKKGFEDGTSWSRTLKGLVRKGKVKTELEPMFQWKTEDLTPERLVLIYSFACYMQSNPQRLNSFAAMVRRIESSNQIPATIEIARLFGFESVEALEADWTNFIKEGDFK
ncbi:hypothetical protein [Luteolibacter marinus]|uniref:hypothetical protein n=1 Tax=Luteolibacter marinus TaxID=2776705 RepID=UPI001866E89D|nr:hypothetical protein [Luteolibacter marinus]